MNVHPISSARELAAAIGIPVMTADVPALVAAIHRHYVLGVRDAAPHAEALVQLERAACADHIAGMRAKSRNALFRSALTTAEWEIRERGQK